MNKPADYRSSWIDTSGESEAEDQSTTSFELDVKLLHGEGGLAYF